MITPKSTIKDVLENPIGRDVLNKILMQMGYSLKLIDNPLVLSMTLERLEKLIGNKVGHDFFETVYKLLNQEQDKATIIDRPIVHKWWKEAIFYQIYPRSFKDKDGDGIGDIRGIISKLDYLKELGIDVIWLSPIYESPLDDNGYDISDYREILSDFGTMDDFDNLIAELNHRGMRLIMDLVVNHTSDEHEWFKEALADPESPKRDYYFFVKNEGKVPNNWVSFFSGPAWKYYPENDEWALHLFSEKQMDLNWSNPQVRKEVQDIVAFWREKGVSGFRMDVINYISKPEELPDGNEAIGNLMEFTGIEHYYFGEHLHEYLHELNVSEFEPYDLFSVGETPGIGFEMSRLLTHEDRKEMDTVFMFDHLETPGHVRFNDYKYDAHFLKQYYQEMYSILTHHEWPSLFFENHDNPRMISKITRDVKLRKRVGKMLGTLMLTLRGTPFIYQGQELGLLNNTFESIDDLRDVESINKYNSLLETMSPKEAWKIVLAGTRDHARTPMPWSEDFSEATPWIESFPQLPLTEQTEMDDPDSIYHWYKELIALRKANSSLVYGDIEFVETKKKNYCGYYRYDDHQQFFIEMNCSEKEVTRYVDTSEFERIASNMKYHLKKLSPYEVNIYRVR